MAVEVTRPGRFVDRSGWASGPWDAEPDRAEWRDGVTGLPCLAVRHGLSGHWCGYVAVPPGHPWHGTDFGEIPADVHGSLTFAESCQVDDRPARERVCHVALPGEPDDVWWLGFDCAHFRDRRPGLEAREAALGLPPDPFPGSRYRTLGFVMAECASLALQARDAATGAAR